MSTGEVLGVAAAVIVAMVTGGCAVLLVLLVRTLRELRATVAAVHAGAEAVLTDARAAVDEATREVERVDRLVRSAERIDGAVDAAGRLAYRTLGSPVVKAMAIGTGVSRAAQRLREPDPEPAPTSRHGRTRPRRRGR